MRLFCFTAEPYPIRLVDVTELFFNEIRRRGVEQTWFCRAGADAGPLRKEYRPGVEIIVPPSITRWGSVGKLVTRCLHWLFETVFMLRLLFKPVDVILVRDRYWAAFLGLIVARLSGRRLAVWLSYPHPEHQQEEAGYAKGPRKLLLKCRAFFGRTLLYRVAMPRADHCFVQSEQMKQDLLKWGIPPQRMTPVPMGIRRDFFDNADARPDSSVAQPPIVLYLGTLSAIRRPEMMVEAFALVAARHRDARFEFVGDGDLPHERQDLERRVASAGLSDRVTFTGFLPMAQAWEHVARASVCLSPFLVTPVLRVASPTKFVEYLAFAKPTVGNRHPEQSMIGDASRGALIVDWSPEAFADAIMWCLEHPDEARAMAERGREWVREHRTYDRIGDLVYGELKRIAGRA